MLVLGLPNNHCYSFPRRKGRSVSPNPLLSWVCNYGFVWYQLRTSDNLFRLVLFQCLYHRCLLRNKLMQWRRCFLMYILNNVTCLSLTTIIRVNALCVFLWGIEKAIGPFRYFVFFVLKSVS